MYWQRGGWGNGPAAGWTKGLRMMRTKSKNAPWFDLGDASRSCRTGSPLCDEPGCSDLHLPALRVVLPASWRGCPQWSSCQEEKRDWKSLASDSSYPAGSGPLEQTRGLHLRARPWSVDSREEAVGGGSQLPLSKARSLSGKHPGSTPGKRDDTGVR